MMFKTKKSKFIVITILVIVGLLCLNPLISNIDYLFGIKEIKNQTIDGDVDVSVTMNVELNAGYFTGVIRYSYYVEYDFRYNESVTAVEIERFDYRIFHNSRNIYTYNGPYWPNIRHTRSIELKYGDNLTYQGSVDFNYQLNSNPQNDTVNYNLVYTLSITEQDAYEYIYLKSCIFIAYIASFFLLPIFLYLIIHPDFLELSKEEKEKSEEFFDNLEKRNLEKRKKSSTKN